MMVRDPKVFVIRLEKLSVMTVSVACIRLNRNFFYVVHHYRVQSLLYNVRILNGNFVISH